MVLPKFPGVTAQPLSDHPCLMLGAQTVSDRNSSHHRVVRYFFVDSTLRGCGHIRGDAITGHILKISFTLHTPRQCLKWL